MNGQVQDDLVRELAGRLMVQQPGIVGVASHQLGRYREFDRCLNEVWIPQNSIRDWYLGLSVCKNYNNMVKTTLEYNKAWLWILDDDHVFPRDLLLNLLERGVDIVAPLYVRRCPPFKPVLHADAKGEFRRYDWDYLNGKSGLVDITADGSAPTGGMLIRREVLEKLQYPWFECGQIDPELGSWDIYFCEKARQAGFKIHVDTENTIGHIIHMALWAKKNEDGTFAHRFTTVSPHIS
jgi:GT2 family glycosyltransferase